MKAPDVKLGAVDEERPLDVLLDHVTRLLPVYQTCRPEETNMAVVPQ
jgi:hypothetical protein